MLTKATLAHMPRILTYVFINDTSLYFPAHSFRETSSMLLSSISRKLVAHSDFQSHRKWIWVATRLELLLWTRRSRATIKLLVCISVNRYCMSVLTCIGNPANNIHAKKQTSVTTSGKWFVSFAFDLHDPSFVRFSILLQGLIPSFIEPVYLI
jgi:hypothetical protein